MIKIKYIPNRFEKEGIVSKKIDYKFHQSLFSCIKKTYPELLDTIDQYAVIYMGSCVTNVYIVYPHKYSQIIITPRVEVGALIAVAKGFLLKMTWGKLAYFAFVGYSIYQAVTARSRMPSFGSSGLGMDEDSPTYGWSGISQTRTEGVPVPIVYGEHRIGGNVINEYIRTDGDKNYLHSLCALCEGEIDSVSGILVNGNPIANFDNVSTTLKNGTNSQTSISDFEDLHNLQSVNVQLTQNNAHTYTTTDSDVEGFEIHLQLASGLYQVDTNSGQVNAWSVTYKVEYQVNPAGGWTDLGSTTIDLKSKSAVRRIYRKVSLAANKYDIKVTRTSADGDFEHTGDLYFDKLDEIKTDNLCYPNTALHAVEVLATEQLQGAVPNITTIVKGKKISAPQVMNGAVVIDWENYYWDATSSQYKLLSDSTVLTWDGSTYVTHFCANPIWCLKDLLLNTRYGLGEFIDSSLIDDTLFEEMSKYCEERILDGNGGYEKRYRLDVVIDTFTSSLDLLIQLTAAFDAFPFYSEGAIKFSIDKPTSVSQVFGMGNIVENSFQQSWKSLKEVCNIIEITYNDADKDYEQETISVMDESIINDSSAQRRRQQLRVFVTRTSQALRIGRYALNVAKYIDRSVSFKAGIDAVACQVGDRIDISHDIPQWGYSGRLQSGNTVSIVKLDRTVTIEAAKNYEIQIRHGADVIETRDVTDGVGDYTQLNITPALSAIPAENDLYNFGEENIVSKEFRVISIERMNTDEVEIKAIEYNVNVYDDSTVTLPTNNYSALSTNIPLVTDLDTTERAVDLLDGTVISVIDVYWDRPDDTDNVNKFKGVKIYMSDDGGDSWSYIGFSEGIKYTINDNIDAATYNIKAVTVCHNGIEDVISNAPQDNITIVGAGRTPDIVSNFAYTWGDKLTLVWSPNTELSLSGYEIRKNNANFGTDDSNLVYRGLATKVVFEPTTRSVGTYYIRAYNNSGAYSTTSASITPVNSAPSQPSNFNVDVLFQIARVYWDDVVDVDVQYYEVWQSETNAWSGEEVLVAKVSGKQAHLEGKKARGGDIDSVTTTTIVDADLIGISNDEFNHDKLLITSGANEGDEVTITDFNGTTGTITVTGWGIATPSVGDNYLIHDRAFIKVRGYDNYGEGAFSNSVTVQYEGIDGEYIEDNVITARKIYVECLSALSANLGCVTAGTVQGITFQTAAGGARIITDSTSMRSYDSACNLMYELCDGHVTAKSMCLVDTACADCYSFLSAGAWYFHDELCNCNPYVKRIDSGRVCTGSTICLCGWCNSPNVQVGINSLDSYNKDHSAQTQQWDIYNSTPTFYCNSSTDYGYCFDVHACLLISSGTGSDVVKSANFNTIVTTCASTCASCVTFRFQQWCNAACANYYYGCVCYCLAYRKSGDGAWCSSSVWHYTQPHASVGEMKTTNTVKQYLVFPCNETWELCAVQVARTWYNSGITSGTVTCLGCCRGFGGGTTFSSVCCSNHPDTGGNLCTYTDSDTSAVAIGGATPTNVVSAYLCACMCTGETDHLCACLCKGISWASVCSLHCACIRFYSSVGNSFGDMYGKCYKDTALWNYSSTMTSCVLNCSGLCSYCLDLNTVKSCAHPCMGVYSYARLGFCTCCGVGVTKVNCAKSRSCLLGGYVCYCYCSMSGSAGSCELKCIHSVQDTFGTQCILDPNGCLNWMAVGFF